APTTSSLTSSCNSNFILNCRISPGPSGVLCKKATPTSSSTILDKVNMPCVLKFLTPEALASAIIGKGGAVIAEMRTKTQARLGLTEHSEFYPGTDCRILTAQVGGIIGKGGTNVKQLREKSGGKISISEPLNAGPGAEQVVSLSGSQQAVEYLMAEVNKQVQALSEEPWFASWIATNSGVAGGMGMGMMPSYSGGHGGGKGGGKGSGGGGGGYGSMGNPGLDLMMQVASGMPPTINIEMGERAYIMSYFMEMGRSFFKVKECGMMAPPGFVSMPRPTARQSGRRGLRAFALLAGTVALGPSTVFLAPSQPRNGLSYFGRDAVPHRAPAVWAAATQDAAVDLEQFVKPWAGTSAGDPDDDAEEESKSETSTAEKGFKKFRRRPTIPALFKTIPLKTEAAISDLSKSLIGELAASPAADIVLVGREEAGKLMIVLSFDTVADDYEAGVEILPRSSGKPRVRVIRGFAPVAGDTPGHVFLKKTTDPTKLAQSMRIGLDRTSSQVSRGI
ncbi:unnamed protein product, partial [Polarella glacialis]